MNSRLLHLVKWTMVSPYLLLWLVSCTVKEDRRVCPCALEVSFHDSVTDKDSVILLGWSEEELFDVRIDTEDYPEVYTQNTPRKIVSFGAIKGMGISIKIGHQLVTPEGHECDSLYAYSEVIDCTGETAHTIVKFHKQFATIHIGIVNTNYNPDDYSFVVTSHSCGIDILNYDAVAGDFRCEPYLYSEKEYRCRVTRQADDSLTLTAIHHTGDKAVFPLGKYISSIGYDWKATELQDVYITLDMSRGKIGVGIADWEIVEDFELSTVEL